MADASSPPPAEHGGRVPPRHLVRWWLKVFRWLLGIAAVSSLLVGVVGWLLWSNLAAVANYVLRDLANPLVIQIAEVGFPEKGRVQAGRLSLNLPAEAGLVASLESLEAGLDWPKLRAGKMDFGPVRLRHPVFRLNDEGLKALRSLGGDSDSVAGAPQASGSPLSVESLDVEQGEIEIHLAGLPKIRAKLGLTAGGLRFEGREWISSEPVQIILRDVVAESGGESSLIVSEIRLMVRARGDFSELVVEDFVWVDTRLKVTPGLLGVLTSGEGKPVEEPPASESPPSGEVGRTVPFRLEIKRIRLDKGSLEVAGFSGKGEAAPWPVLPEITSRLAFESSGLILEGGGVSEEGTAAFRLQELAARTPGQASETLPLLRLGELELGIDWRKLLEHQEIGRLILKSPVIHASRENLTAWLPGSAAASEPASEDPVPTQEEDQDPTPWRLARLEIQDGRLNLDAFSVGELPLPGGGTGFEFEGGGFSTGPEKAAPDQVQTLRLKDLSLGPEERPALAWKALRLSGTWAGLNAKRLDTLKLEGPRLTITDASLEPWREWLEAPDRKADGHNEEGTPPAPEAASGPEAPVWAVGDLSVEDGEFLLDTGVMDGRLPVASGGFRMKSAPPGGERYDAIVEGLRFREHRSGRVARLPSADLGEQEEDIYFARQVSVAFTARGVQRDQHLEKVEISGSTLKVGEKLQAMASRLAGEGKPDEAEPASAPADESPGGGAAAPDGSLFPPSADPPVPGGVQPASAPEEPPLLAQADTAQAAPAAPAAPAPAGPGPGKKGWTIGELAVVESRVRFESLLPELEGLEFAIETRLTDVPLGGLDDAVSQRMQKVELSSIEIRDPYDSFITVAFIPSMFIEFRMSGLARQEIEKIDLIGPTIYVGQPLFWWIDYQRKHRTTNEGTSFQGLDEEGAPVEAPDAPPPAPPDAETASQWRVKLIEINAGKLVIAPTGHPIGIVPFPFSASTNLQEGRIALKLQIPKEQYTYAFPDLKLDLFGLRGDIEFNLPLEQKDVNLVQTFHLDRAVWKNFESEKLYLTVTYDAKGIYGSFGGEAYDGYANGGFNIYLSDLGRWDGWIAGTKMDTEPLTRILAPDSFLMTGVVSTKLTSEGRGLELGKTSGTFETLTPGKIDVEQLQATLDSLPEDYSQLQRSLIKLGLETVKVFDYDQGQGSVDLQNRDGSLRLELKGPTGSRALNMHFHDWRPGKEKEQDREKGLPTP